MAKIALVYASKSGRNQKIATYLAQKLAAMQQRVDSYPIVEIEPVQLKPYETILLVSYTYHDGQIPDECEPFLADLGTVDFSGKCYALAGSSSSEHEHFGRALDYFDQQFANLGAKRATAILKIDLDADRADLARLDAFCQQLVDFQTWQ